MNTKQFWKIFITVFVIAFVANVVVAYLWNRFMPESNWNWDTSTTTATIIGLATAYLYKKDNS